MTARNGAPEWGDDRGRAGTPASNETKTTLQAPRPCKAQRKMLKQKGEKDTAVREMPC